VIERRRSGAGASGGANSGRPGPRSPNPAPGAPGSARGPVFADRSLVASSFAASGARPRLLVATHSAHKLAELRELLQLERGELVGLDEAGIDDEPDETGTTFETNARIKARFGARRTGLPTLADDSGLQVDALGGGPDVRTRRYAGPDATDVDNNTKLLAALDGLPADQRGARYVCVLALALPRADARPGDAVPIRTVRGTTRGRIATEPRGTGGFGYDPIFEPQGEPPGGRTFALWSATEKNAVSHRGRAARRMTPILRELGF
jgi:XTP/dITP diphosphohydrolase